MKILKRAQKFLKPLAIMGNFGIGTDAPTAKVDVDGDLKVAVVPADNNLTKILVADGDGNFFTRELDTVFADDIHITNTTYNETTKVLRIDLSNSTSQNIDLSSLVDIQVSSLEDADADTKLFITEDAGGDFVHVQAAGVSIAEFAKEKVEFKKLMNFEAGFGFALRAVNASDSIAANDHTLVVDATVSGIVMTLPSISSVSAGKVYEVKVINSANAVSVATSGADTIKGLSAFNLNHSYIRVQANAVDNEWVVVEEVRAGGFLVEQVAPANGTTITFPELVGFDTTNFDFLRDGLTESGSTEYSFNSSNGTLTVTEAFEGELLQVRLN